MESDDSLSTKIFACSRDQQPQTTVAKKRRKKPKHPCVWEYSAPDYKDRHKRELAWRKIQKRCPGHTVDDCKAKWANVKTAFQNVKKKMQAKFGQEARSIEPQWPYWTAMQFCNRDHTSKRSSPVRALDVQKSQLDYSTSQSYSLPETASSSFPETTILNRSDVLQRSVDCLDPEKDNWHAIGMYLASQMREIAKKNRKAANRLHLHLVKSVMEATLKVEDENDI